MIGDVLISSIICNNLRKAYPKAQIDYLVYESTLPVLEGNTSINNLIVFKEIHRSSKKELLKLALSIRASKYDLIIDAYSKLESWLLVALSGAKRKISYKKPGRTFLYTDNVPFAEFPKTNLGLAIERRLSLLAPLQLDITLDPHPHLFVSKNEISEAKNFLAQHKVPVTNKKVMISIIGSDITKTYPLEYMSKCIDAIALCDNLSLFFNYFPKQKETAQIIYNKCNIATQQKIHFEVFGGSLRSFIGIMNECDLIIGNDGGAINMAKALNKPSFTIFSPWIEKKIWATYEDGVKHCSVHLHDFMPELFESKREKDLKKQALTLYKEFKPDFFIEQLKQFLQQNLSSCE